ncbi:MAG: hypothetical protein RLZZ76_589 [Candidatus Parcubacteria bacterium]|jgi:hypothetical protein
MKATRKVETSSLKKKVSSSRTNVSRKKAVQKKSVFIKVSTTKDKLDSKLQSIAELHTKQKKQEPHSVDLLPKSFFESALQLKPKFEIALMSPYRFPITMDSQKIAVGIARYSGILFVVLGALSTLFFLQALSGGTTAQLATVYSSTETTAASTTITSQVRIDCTDPLQYGSQTCSTTVDRTPDVQFDIAGTQSVLSGFVRVALKVPFAKAVKITVRSVETGEFFDGGVLTSGALDTWESNLDTTKLHDGTYKISALITNAYGTYEAVFASRITIQNAELPVPVAMTTSDTLVQTAPSTQTQETVTTYPLLRALSPLAEKEFRFEIETDGATTIKLFATKLSNSTEVFLGTAYKVTTQLWKYRWNAGDYANGEYRVRAQTIKDGVTLTSQPVIVTKSSSTTPLVEQTVPETVVSPLLTKPPVTIDVQASSPLAGSVGVHVSVADAKKVELFTVKEGELSERYIGTAKAIDTNIWVLFIDTKNIPNGTYRFLARVQNTFGAYSETTESIVVRNVTAPLTDTQKNLVEQIVQVEATLPALQSASTTSVLAIDDAQLSESDVKTIEELFAERLLRLSAAIRLGDAQAIEAIKREVATVPDGTPESIEQFKKLKSHIEAYLTEATKKIEEKIALTNKLFSERTQEKATEDSDGDGIANYDEVTLFKTNPYVADTDGDGFFDGVEIEGGYNPNDDSSEALIVYESPKEAGVIREELLSVASITTVARDLESPATQPLAAIISGTGLPNSFVSLYIFSNPVVVSVKTDAEGSWVYRFDKELDTGEHEVYVAVTDNAGKIVAKSKPFAFVKEAEAFTGVTNPNQVTEVPAPVVPEVSFLSRYMIYLVLSISVVAIGLVLILLGLHLETRARVYRESEVIESQPA